MAFAAVTILMDTLHQHFLQPTPRFPLRNKTKVTLLYKHLSSLQTSLEQDFKVGECDEAMKALEAQMRDVSIELRFQIEHHLRLFYLGKSMKLRLHSAQKLLPILNGAIKGGIETMDLKFVWEMLGKHLMLPVSGMPPHIKKRVLSFCTQYDYLFFKRWSEDEEESEDELESGDEKESEDELESGDEKERRNEWETKEDTDDEQGSQDEHEESDDEWETEEEQNSDDEPEESDDEWETEKEQNSDYEHEESDDEWETEEEQNSDYEHEESDDEWETEEEQNSDDEQEESDDEQGSEDEQEPKKDTEDEWENKEEQKSDDEQRSEDEQEESDDEQGSQNEQVERVDEWKTEILQRILSEAESIIRQELRAPSYLNKYMKQRIHARHKIHQICMQGIKLTSYIKKEVLKVKNAHYNQSNTPQGNNTNSASLTVGDSLQHTTIEMVGCDDEFNIIMDKLNQPSKQREIVSIVGMGGIGKTTLAKRIYGDASFISRFHSRAWVTISQDYNPIKVLNALLHCLDPAWVVEGEENNELAMQVDKCVKGKRYLIVIDDIWSTNVLDDLLRCFKDGKNGSRMLLTTRLKNVAEYADSGGNLCHNMRFLDSYESWNLFHNHVLSQRITLSPEFERIGREIVKKCKGLPLAINVVAGLLSNPKQDLNEWELIAKNVHKVSIDHSNQQRENIIDLSYTFLPHHLKHCFLSIGLFREDEELAEDFVVDYWVSEGFLKVLRSKSLEDVARESLKDLVDRNLLLISTKIGFNGSMNVYQMHDVLRELALREAGKENLLCLKNDRYFFSVGIRRTQLRNSSHTCSTFLSCTFCDYRLHDHYFKFVRGFVSKRIYLLGVPHYDAYASMEFMGLVHLRYLNSYATLKLHSLPLFMLWNLQKLYVDCFPSTNEPLNIWRLPQLKNIHLLRPNGRRSIRLVLPRSVHHNLESIIYLDHRNCTEELFMRIPNLRRLGIMGSCNLKRKAFNWFESLACLYKLEDLLLCGKLLHPKFSTLHFTGTLSVENFLPNLKRLKLLHTRLNWKNMYVVEMLPKLEVLILESNAAVGGKWKPTDRGFPGLKFLIIGSCDLQIWKATGDHFPILECLVLMELNYFKKIPSDFADITTLKSIKLFECSKSTISSAKCIQKEKLDYGNDAFTVDISRDHDFDGSLWD